MAKPKQPIFSLDAKGTLGDAITYQGSHGSTILRKKPIPFQPNSPAQIAQRSAYLAACKMWGGLSSAERLLWRIAGTSHGLTAFSYFLSVFLPTLPGIAAYYPLNEGVGVIAGDLTLYRNNGTIYGCLWLPGVYGSCLWFDSIDDRVEIRHNDNYNATTEITLEAFIRLNSVAGLDTIIAKRQGVTCNYAFRHSASELTFYFYNAGWCVWDTIGANLAPFTWYYVACSYTAGSNPIIVVNSQPQNGVWTMGTPKVMLPNTIPLNIGRCIVEQYMHGRIDEPTLYTRALTLSDLQIHAERSYP